MLQFPSLRFPVVLSSLTLFTALPLQASNFWNFETVSPQVARKEEKDDDWIKRIRPDHPRIFFNADMVPRIRELVKGELKEEWEALKARADSYPSEPVGNAGGPVRMAVSVVAGKEVSVREVPPAKEWGQEAADCALAWLISGEEVYLRKAQKMLKVSVQVYRECDEYLRMVTYYSDSRLHALAAYDWIYNALTEDERRAIIIPFLAHVRRIQPGQKPLIYRNNTYDYTTGFYGAPNLVWYAGLAAHGDGFDDPAAREMLIKGRKDLQRLFDYRGEIAGEDGGMPSSTVNYAMKTYPTAQFNFLHSWASATNENIAMLYPSLGLFSNWIFWNWIPDAVNGGPYEFGDGDSLHYHNQLPTAWLFDHLTQLLYFYRDADPKAASLAKSLRSLTREKHFSSRWNFFPFIMPPRTVAEGVKELDLTSLPLRARYFEGLGQALFRSGFRPGDTFALFSIGAKSRMHRHLDENHFTIYKEGFLALDSGTRGNSEDYHLRHYYAQSVAHNVVLIHKPGEVTPETWGMQCPAPEGKISHGGMQPVSGKPIAFETNKEYSYIAGDTTGCYNGKAEQAVRQFVHLQPDFFIVYDRIISSEPSYRKEWILHTQNEPKVEGMTFQVDEGAGRLFVRSLLPAQSRLERVGGPGKAFWASGTNWALNDTVLKTLAEWKATLGGRSSPVGEWRAEVSPLKEQAAIEFLHLLQATDQHHKEIVESTLIQSGDQDGVRIILPSSTGEEEKAVTIFFNRTGEIGGMVRLEQKGKVVWERPLTRKVEKQSGVIF